MSGRPVDENGCLLDEEEWIDSQPQNEAEEIAALRRELEKARKELQTANMCSVCFGYPHASGKVCICGGENTRAALYAGLHRELAVAETDRDEAREWVRKLTAETRVLTCIYCGHAYPPGAPGHGAEVLTAHAEKCEKHPLSAMTMRAASAEMSIGQLRAALVVAHDAMVSWFSSEYAGHPASRAVAAALDAVRAGKEGK